MDAAPEPHGRVYAFFGARRKSRSRQASILRLYRSSADTAAYDSAAASRHSTNDAVT